MVFVVVVFGLLLLGLVDEVRTGHGLDYGITASGARSNAFIALATFAALAVILPIAFVLGWWLRRRERRQISN